MGQRPGVVEVEATTGEATSEVTKAVEQKGGTAAVPKVPPKSVARQILGSAATFLTSGLVHEVIFYYLTGRTSGGLWLSYFLAQVPVVAVERTVLSMLRRWGIVVPQPLMVLYGVVFECAASAKLFWGPAERAGVVHDIVTGVTVSNLHLF